MNAEKIGVFISSLRKEKGLTQTELAEKLNISNRTVSKWENGDGFPDITILPELAEILGVSVDELLNGEKPVVEKEENSIKFEAVFKESKKEWIKGFKCILESVNKQSWASYAVLLLGIIICLTIKINIFNIQYVWVFNIYKGLAIACFVLFALYVFFPFLSAWSHIRNVKLSYGEIPEKRIKFSDKIYIEMGEDARGRMYYPYEYITKFIISDDLYIIILNKEVYLYLPKNSINDVEKREFESLIASHSKDVYDTLSRKKLNKVFKILYIILISFTIAVYGLYSYSTNPHYFYNNLAEKQQYYYDNEAEFSRGLKNVQNDKELQNEVQSEGSAAYYAEEYINLDKISDVEIVTGCVCFDSYFGEDKYYSGYVYYEGEGIPTPKDMNLEEGKLDKEKPKYLEDEEIYLIGKEKNGSLTKNEWFLVMPLENNWYYCEYH